MTTLQALSQTPPMLGDVLKRAYGRYADRIAFVWDGGQLSYRGLRDWCGRAQAVLAAAGCSHGTRVAMLAGNRWEAWAANNASMSAGLVTTMLHQLGSLEDHLFQLKDIGAQVLVVDAGPFGERAAALVAGHPGLKVFTLGPSSMGTDLCAAVERIGEATLRCLVQPDDMCNVQYTGGTTGRSKGAVRNHASNSAMYQDLLANYEIPERPHYLAAAPITHVAGAFVPATLIRGGTVRLMSGFAPDRWLQLVGEERCNFSLLVPTMIYMVLDHPKLASTDLSALHSLIYGASPMSPTRLVEGLERMGPVFAQLYAQTEGFPITFLRREDHDAAHPELFSSCGIPTSMKQVVLLDDNDQPVAPGEAGELCVRGPGLMTEYLNMPEATAETLRGGWLHTGDVARADEQGYLYIVDRKKDMIVSGGFNVYPRDVEDVISAHPAVAMVAVIGVPDAKWGEAVTAVVQCRPGASATDREALAEELKASVRQAKGAVHTPKHVEFTDQIPRTAVGKIDKKVLRAPYWQGQSRQVG
ncbi:MAG: AMP-binding protein [Burkholderiales bacterium]